jgi:hypothetical protein
LVADTKTLSSLDGKFKYELAKTSEDFFVVMSTFGVPSGYSGQPSLGPYGVFSSSESSLPGAVTLSGNKIQAFVGGKWTSPEGQDSSDIGIFMATP